MKLIFDLPLSLPPTAGRIGKWHTHKYWQLTHTHTHTGQPRSVWNVRSEKVRAVAGESPTNLLFSIISLIGYTRTRRSARAHSISVLPRRVAGRLTGKRWNSDSGFSVELFFQHNPHQIISHHLPPERFLRFFFGVVFFCRRILKLYGKVPTTWGLEVFQSVGETHLCAFTGKVGGDVELLEQLTRSRSRSPSPSAFI